MKGDLFDYVTRVLQRREDFYGGTMLLQKEKV